MGATDTLKFAFFILSSSLSYRYPLLSTPWIGGLTPVRVTASYSNEGLKATTIGSLVFPVLILVELPEILFHISPNIFVLYLKLGQIRAK